MKKSIKFIVSLLVITISSCSLVGCSLQDKIDEYSNDKEQCYLNAENVTQLISGDKLYQITTKTISKDELGNYIDILVKNIIFDTATKVPLSDKELGKIDWSGDNKGQEREQWVYKDIYEIKNIDKNEAIAVMVNNQYYIAKRQ